VSVDAVREAVAARHGLSAEAASFLSGSTVEEIEQSAEQLARFVDEHGRREEPAPPTLDPISAALADKRAQKRRLAEWLTASPKPSQPRDEQGRYASFDGGARPSLPVRKSDPTREHDQLVTGLANFARTFGL
jgi:hypothetical protein